MIKSGDTCVRSCADVDLINRNIEAVKTQTEYLTLKAKQFNLLGNETRLNIVYIIKNEKSVCVCDLSDILGYSISAISQQLKKLKLGGILINQKENQTIFYSIHPDIDLILTELLNLQILNIAI